ncbi:MAG TPA: sensor histidine kinase [Jatrophihabitans sp.]
MAAHGPDEQVPDAPTSRWLTRLRRPRFRSWLQAHPTLLDCLLVLVLDAWVLGSLHHRAGNSGWWSVLFSQLLVLPLIFRRRHPWAVFVLLASLAAVQWLTDVRLAADAALLIALYTVAAHCSRRRALVAAGVIEVGVVLASIRFAPTGDGVLASMVFLSGMVAAALFSGITLRTRRQYLAALVERATRLEYERDQQTRLAATAERTRIARELHDVIAHSLSVIITLADAAVLAEQTDPTQAREAMLQVAATGRGSMAEMRRLLGVLREADAGDGVELSPQPGLERLDTLIADVRAAGLPVELSVTGTPQPFTPTAQSTAYRIIQESLTNVLKHADNPTRVRVEIRWSSDGMRIDVTDDGRTAGAGGVTGRPEVGVGVSAGNGMIGMRERAGLFHGTVEAGPTPYGGWRVHAILPAPGTQ